MRILYWTWSVFSLSMDDQRIFEIVAWVRCNLFEMANVFTIFIHEFYSRVYSLLKSAPKICKFMALIASSIGISALEIVWRILCEYHSWFSLRKMLGKSVERTHFKISKCDRKTVNLFSENCTILTLVFLSKLCPSVNFITTVSFWAHPLRYIYYHSKMYGKWCRHMVK